MAIARTFDGTDDYLFLDGDTVDVTATGFTTSP